ncbi:MAG: LacI family transcriptional regulator [Rhodocyclaceae bacterium]|nr:LacI family transcriptional regulator [Rhodocyclaceae bacterium]
MAASDTVDLGLAMHLLRLAVDAAGKRGKAHVATRLGVSRCYVSRVLSPTDTCRCPLSDAVAQRIIDRYHVIPECPATLQPQPRSECARISHGAAPTHNPLSMRIWRVCQTCVHKPEEIAK